MPLPLLQPRASREPQGDGKSAPGFSPVLAWGALCSLRPPSMGEWPGRGLLVSRRPRSCSHRTNGPGTKFSEHPRPVLKLGEVWRVWGSRAPGHKLCALQSGGQAPVFAGT